MELTRNQQHYIIMTVVYDELADFAMGNSDSFRDARDLISSLCEKPIEEVDPYIINSVTAVLQNYGTIVSAITPFLKGWTWERIPLLSRSILLMSYAHYYYVEKTDKKIIINIAVELAKKYIEEKQAKFINAILDGVLK